MRIQTRKEYDNIKEHRGTNCSFGSSKGKTVNDRLQHFKPYQNLKIENDEVRHFPVINNNNNNNNGVDEHDIDLAGHPGEGQNDSTHKTPVIGKGLWSFEEDQFLKTLVNAYGEKKWSQLARSFDSKTGKQCRERWHNHLRPDIKEQPWTEEEERVLIEAHSMYGNRWVQIAKYIPGRTENAIKNHWNTNKRKNSRRNYVYKRPKPRTALQEYIATVDQSGQEKKNASNARPKVPAPEEQMAYPSFNLNQPVVSEAEEMAFNGANLYQSVMPEAEDRMMYARANSHQPDIQDLRGEMFYPGSNSNLNAHQLLALSSDEVNPVGSFTELLGLDVNSMYAPEYVPCGRYAYSHNIGPIYFGEDIGCSSSHGAPSEPAQACYKNMSMMRSEKTDCVDVKGKGKMIF